MSAIVEYAELADDIDHPVRTYSSGMMTRLGFAIAIQASPNVLLTYEVPGVGDANFGKKSYATLANSINSDRTVVIVPHNEDALRQHCDRVVWTDAGTTKMIGPPEQVLSEYSKVMNK